MNELPTRINQQIQKLKLNEDASINGGWRRERCDTSSHVVRFYTKTYRAGRQPLKAEIEIHRKPYKYSVVWRVIGASDVGTLASDEENDLALAIKKLETYIYMQSTSYKIMTALNRGMSVVIKAIGYLLLIIAIGVVLGGLSAIASLVGWAFVDVASTALNTPLGGLSGSLLSYSAAYFSWQYLVMFLYAIYVFWVTNEVANSR